MPTKKDQDKADEQAQTESVVAETPKARQNTRIKGAYQLAGTWYAADGSLLTDPEAQLAHRARDKAEAEARRKALLGGVE